MSKASKFDGAYIAGFIMGIPVCATIFYWYNSVIYHVQLEWWKWLIIMPFIMILQMTKNPFTRFLILLTIPTAVIGQILGWIGVIKLPIF